MLKCWIYHKTNEPKIVNSKDAQSFYDNGWVNSPAEFTKTTDFGVDADDPIAVQNLGETVEGLVDQLNGQLNLGEMKNRELIAYASKHFGKDIKGKKQILIAQIESFIHGNAD